MCDWHSVIDTDLQPPTMPQAPSSASCCHGWKTFWKTPSPSTCWWRASWPSWLRTHSLCSGPSCSAPSHMTSPTCARSIRYQTRTNARTHRWVLVCLFLLWLRALQGAGVRARPDWTLRHSQTRLPSADHSGLEVPAGQRPRLQVSRYVNTHQNTLVWFCYRNCSCHWRKSQHWFCYAKHTLLYFHFTAQYTIMCFRSVNPDLSKCFYSECWLNRQLTLLSLSNFNQLNSCYCCNKGPVCTFWLDVRFYSD